MRVFATLLAPIATAVAFASAWGVTPVRVATNPGLGGVALGNVLLYPGSSAASGSELWRSDGTVAGTFMVKDLFAGPGDSFPLNFAVAGGVAYFTTHAADGTYALWKSDGTAGGTSKVKDLLPGAPTLLQVAGPTVYFNVLVGDDVQVWRSDGTDAGTLALQGGFQFGADEFTAAAGKVFFSVTDLAHGRGLWMTDGTPAGTGLVKDINPGSNALVGNIQAMNGFVLFTAYGPPDFQLHLWRSDGTAAGTQPLGGPTVGDVGFALGNAILFTGTDASGAELWRTDGTAAGTTLVKDLMPGGGSSSPHDYTAFRGVDYFSATLNTGSIALFRSDGTAAGTTQAPAAFPTAIADTIGGAVNDLYFVAQNALWRANFDLASVNKVYQLAANDTFGRFRMAPNGLYFSVNVSATSGSELWFMRSQDPLADDDGDGVPNGVEAAEGLDSLVKDNDIFGSARLFAMQQYRDFLGREGDAGGIQFYTDAITNGTSTRRQVIENFLASPEFQNGLPQCTRLYFSFFLRIPDYAGLLFQVNAFRSGTPLEAIAQNFYNSPEFTARYGALSNDDYINLVYQNVLGRAPDPGGFAFYKNLLDNNTITKGQMMIGFSESPEFQQISDSEVYVTAAYVGMLRRAPDAGGLDFYVNLIAGGTPRNSIIDGFLGSPEYRSRFLP